MKNIYMIGNTHFDPVWLWKWDEAMASIHSTFRSALDRMKEDKDFIYSFATPPVFEWIRQVDPDMFAEITERVREGRWGLCEGWYLQPDCYTGTGESYVRHSLYGQRYLMENFGKYSDTVFNIDSFGHNSITPQILQKSHMQYYCMCRPEIYHYDIPSPYFAWKGKDGSTVRAFRAGQFSEIYNKDMAKNVEKAEEHLGTSDCDELMVYGVTNHGGAPTKKAIADIHLLNDEKDYDIRFSTVTGYFEAQDEPKVTVEGEMITGDFGVYTNNHEIKKRNRIAEYAVLNAEKASVIAGKLMSRPYPKAKLKGCWEDVLFNQFHDILGGASIKQAYFDAYNGQGRAIQTADEITHFALQSITHQIRMPGRNPDNAWNLVVWNLNDQPYAGPIEGEVQWLHEFPAYTGGMVVKDETGKVYPCQIILERSVIEGFRTRFVFDGDVPAMGYKSFIVYQTGEEAVVVADEELKTIDTGAFVVDFNQETGFIDSIRSRKTDKTFENILIPECFADEADTWCFKTTGYGCRLEDFRPESIAVTENGHYRTTVKAVHTFRKSRLTLYYTFYNDKDYFDVKYIVNWNEKHTVLKLTFHTGCSELIVASPGSTESRGDCTADKPMGEWLSMQDGTCGVSLIADSLFSYNKIGDSVSLSVLRSCIYGDLRLCDLNPKADYPYMEQGITEGGVRVMIHTGDFAENRIPALAASFNNPPLVICEANHDGIFAAEHSFMGLECESVYVGAVKECEDDDSLIVRLYEFAGKEQTAILHFFGRVMEIPVKPYEIRTIRIRGNVWEEVYMTED